MRLLDVDIGYSSDEGGECTNFIDGVDSIPPFRAITTFSNNEENADTFETKTEKKSGESDDTVPTFPAKQNEFIAINIGERVKMFASMVLSYPLPFPGIWTANLIAYNSI